MKPCSSLLLFSPSTLALFFASLSIVPTPTVALLCWTDLCDTAKWCIERCEGDHISCLAQYRRISSGDLYASYFGCQHTALPSSHSCVPVEGQASDFSCACSGDLCNNIVGVTPSGDDPQPVPNPQTPPPPHEDYLVCEFYNCSGLSLDHRDCYYGYTQCDRNLPNNQTSYCYARYNMFNGSSQLELEAKGCTDVDFGCSDECVAMNDDGKQPPIECCCKGDVCNVNVTFTHPERVDLRLVDPCSNLQCHHSCIVHSGVPQCYCKPGYSLSPDNTSCVDINECNFNNGKCKINCINVAGSYHCGCPDNQRLSADGLSCEETGLICHSLGCNSSECNTVPRNQYCDDSSTSTKQHCQATYKRYENGTYKPRLLSCFAGDFHCEPGVCVLSKTHKENIYYCCCDGNYCNLQLKFPNVSIVEGTVNSGIRPSSSWLTHVTTATSGLLNPSGVPYTTAPSRNSLTQSQLTFIIVVVLSLVVLIPVVSVGVVCIYCMHKNDKYTHSRPSSTEPDTYSPNIGLSHLSFIDKIGQGRFAAVWRAKMIEDEIAVKVFPNTPQCYESWSRESEIYETPELEHKYILSFRGSHEKDSELWILTDYYSLGSLQDLLKRQTVTLKQFCELAESAAVGLAHLHDQRIVDGLTKKPSIAHRDLKSKNILVRNDFTCVISDFGLAIKFLNEESSTDAHGQVGTSRYMAPEVLEGAISFQREAYLRIDVYAFALILWEVASRTALDNCSVKQYHPPFEEYVSPNPSIEEMREVVVTQFKRPTILKGFTTSGEYDCLQDTVEESWDQEPEARLSAQCIAERIRTFKLSKFSSKDSGLTHSPVENTYNSDSLDSHLTHTSPSPSSSVVTMSASNLKQVWDSGTESMGVYNHTLSNETVPLGGNTSSSGFSPYHSTELHANGRSHFSMLGSRGRYNRVAYSVHSTETTV